MPEILRAERGETAEDPLAPFRGVVVGLLISLPIYVVIGLAVWLAVAT